MVAHACNPSTGSGRVERFEDFWGLLVKTVHSNRRAPDAVRNSSLKMRWRLGLADATLILLLRSGDRKLCELAVAWSP